MNTGRASRADIDPGLPHSDVSTHVSLSLEGTEPTDARKKTLAAVFVHPRRSLRAGTIVCPTR